MLIIGEFVLSVTVFLMRLFNNPHSLGAGKYWEDVVICIPIIMWMLVFILPGISAIFLYCFLDISFGFLP